MVKFKVTSVSYFIFSACACAFTVVFLTFRNFEAEDSYILSRYVNNFIQSNGLVYNHGEYITALTSPFHAMVISLLSMFVHYPVEINRTLSVILMVITFGKVLMYFKDRLDLFNTASLLLLPSPFIILWSLGGLETTYLMFLVTSLVILVLKISGKVNKKQAVICSVLSALIFLTRYDSVVFTLPIMLFLLLNSRKNYLYLILPALLIIGSWFAFSQFYYHDIFPTSVYVKHPSFRAGVAFNNGLYFLHFIFLSGLFIFIGRIKKINHIWLGVGLAGIIIYGLITATTHMFFAYRLWISYLPVFVIFFLDNSEEINSLRIKRWAIPIVHAFVFFWMTYVCLDPRLPIVKAEFSPRDRSVLDYVMGSKPDAQINALKEHNALQHKNHKPRLATYAGGYVPYKLPDVYVFDMLVSYRKKCTEQHTGFATYFAYSDYFQVILPWQQRAMDMAGLTKDSLEIIHSYKGTIEGEEQSFILYYNKLPLQNPLSAFVNGECN
jgi:arabinofuranosyltransferase